MTQRVGRPAGERGAAVAEFAVVMPAVALVLALSLGAVQTVALQVRLQDAAAVAARALGRGEGLQLAAERLERAAPGAQLEPSEQGEAICVAVRMQAQIAGVLTVPLEAGSCALAAGR